jgi:hypothetical protein
MKEMCGVFRAEDGRGNGSKLSETSFVVVEI